MKDLPAIKGRKYIARLIAEGEHEHQDFKFAISDARKIARSVSAFANNDGGILLIGVKDNGCIAGVRNEEDIYVVEQAARSYCRPACDVNFTAFKVENGTIVIRAAIARADKKPVYAQDTDGTWKAYYRVNDENVIAHPLMVKTWERQSRDEELMLQLSDKESRVLSGLASSQPTTIEAIMISNHLSRSMAEDIVVKLAAIGIISFIHDGQGFKISGPATDNSSIR